VEACARARGCREEAKNSFPEVPRGFRFKGETLNLPEVNGRNGPISPANFPVTPVHCAPPRAAVQARAMIGRKQRAGAPKSWVEVSTREEPPGAADSRGTREPNKTI